MMSKASDSSNWDAEREQLLELLLEEKQKSSDWSSLTLLAEGGAGTPLFNVGVFQFRHLAPLLAADRPVYGLAGKNLDEDLEYTKRVAFLASGYIEEIKSVQPEGPYRLGGFCFGGLVAYEMACQLHQRGETVSHLILLDTVNPLIEPHSASQQGSGTMSDRLRYHWERVKDTHGEHLGRWLLNRLKFEWRHRIEQLKRGIARTYQALGRSVPHRFTGALTYDSDSKAASAYRPEPFEGSIMLVRGIDEKSQDDQLWQANPTFGWEELVKGEITVEDLAGGHMHLLDPPHVKPLAAMLRRYLSEPDG